MRDKPWSERSEPACAADRCRVVFDCEALLLTERKSIINHLLGIGKTSHVTPLQLHVKWLVVENSILLIVIVILLLFWEYNVS